MSDLHQESPKRKPTFAGEKFIAMDVICFDTQLKPVDKLVAYIILQHLNENDVKAGAWPGEQRIATLIGGVSVDTVRRSIKRLVKTGYFSATRRKGTSNLYRWTGGRSEHFKAVRSMLTSYKETPSTDATTPSHRCQDPPSSHATSPLAPLPHELIKEHINEPIKEHDAALSRGRVVLNGEILSPSDPSAEVLKSLYYNFDGEHYRDDLNERTKELYGSTYDELVERYHAKQNGRR